MVPIFVMYFPPPFDPVVYYYCVHVFQNQVSMFPMQTKLNVAFFYFVQIIRFVVIIRWDVTERECKIIQLHNIRTLVSSSTLLAFQTNTKRQYELVSMQKRALQLRKSIAQLWQVIPISRSSCVLARPLISLPSSPHK